MSRIALIGENSIEYVHYLLQIWNNHDCAVLIDPKIPWEVALQMMREADVSQCYIEDHLCGRVLPWIEDEIKFNPFACKSENTAAPLPAEIRNKFHENRTTEEAVVLYSSGTTGKSRGVILTHYAINSNADMIIDYMNLNENDSLYIVKSFTHSSTLIGELLVALKVGARIIVSPTIVPPRYVLSRISIYGITIICLNPTLLRMYTDECAKQQYNLSSLKTIYCSGEILNDKTFLRAHEYFSGINIFNVYGLSEAGPRVTAQTKDCCKSNSVGKPIRNVELIIVNEQNAVADIGECGAIHIKTPSLFKGYIKGTQKHISLYENWYNTGDMGYFDSFGELHIVGRSDEVIIIDSRKIYPGDVEQKILELTGVQECVITGIQENERLYLGCLYTGNTSPNDIRKQLGKFLPIYEIPKLIVKTNHIPKNRNGKADKNEVKETLSKSWKGNHKMTQEKIKESVIDLLAELFAEQNFDRDILEYIDLIDDAGMDSITFITLVVEIEAKFNVTVPDDMLLMENFKNADDILRIVENELAKGEENSNG